MRKLIGISALSMAMTAGGALAQTVYTRVPPSERLGVGEVFGDAAPEVQLVMVLLLAGTVWSLIVWAMSLSKVGQGDAKAVATALGRLRIVRSGGVMLGLLGAAYNVFSSALGIANVRPAPDITVMAPGLAEASLCVMLGLLASTVAVICERHLEGRVRRAAA